VHVLCIFQDIILETYMNQLPYLNVQKPTPAEISTNNKSAEYSSFIYNRIFRVSRWLKYERSEKRISHAGEPGGGEAHVLFGHAHIVIAFLSFCRQVQVILVPSSLK
jgi:hypothetical protein